jgi:hypothetical protein
MSTGLGDGYSYTSRFVMQVDSSQVQKFTTNFGKDMGKNQKIVKKNIKETNDELRKLRHGILFTGLGFLFTGMAIRRALQSVSTASFGAFNRIDQGQTAARVGVAKLSAEFEYLKYTVGKALAEGLLPFLPALVELIRKVGDFIKKDPEKAFKLFFGVFIGATAMMVAGQVLTFVSSLGALASVLGSGKDGGLTFDLKTATSAATNFYNSYSTLIGLGAIGLGISFFIEAMDDLFNEEWASAFLGVLSSGFLIVGGVRIMQGAGKGLPLVLIGVGLELLKDEKLGKTVFTVFAPLGAAIMTFFDWLFGDITKGWMEMVKNLLIRTIDAMAMVMGGALFKKIAGKSAGTAIAEAMGIKSKEFDVVESYKKNFGIYRGMGASFDAQVGSFIDAADEMYAGGVVTKGGAPSLSEVKNYNIPSININFTSQGPVTADNATNIAKALAVQLNLDVNKQTR